LILLRYTVISRLRSKLIHLRYLIFALILATSCTDSLSDCHETTSDTFKTEKVNCPGASIIKYEFEGNTVIAYSDGQCISDGGVSVFDEDCTPICFLGGIAGFTLCNGVDFFAQAKQKEVIWEVK
jgi:hypothetical protein